MGKIDRDILVEIVPMQEHHIPALAQLERICFSQPWSDNSLRSELSNQLSVFLVAQQHDHTVGYAGMQCVAGECYIHNVAVFPVYRGIGIGTRLVQALIDKAIRTHADFITLEVRVSNQQAISVYERLGFERAGCRKNFYALPTEDGLIMTKIFKKQ